MVPRSSFGIFEMITRDCKPEFVVFYHGSAVDGLDQLLPPDQSGVLSETGRNKNLDKVFFTKDKGLAEIYSKRAARSYGGKPVLYRVVCPVNVVCMNDTKGSSVYYADHAFLEKIEEFGKVRN